MSTSLYDCYNLFEYNVAIGPLTRLAALYVEIRICRYKRASMLLPLFRQGFWSLGVLLISDMNGMLLSNLPAKGGLFWIKYSFWVASVNFDTYHTASTPVPICSQEFSFTISALVVGHPVSLCFARVSNNLGSYINTMIHL